MIARRTQAYSGQNRMHMAGMKNPRAAAAFFHALVQVFVERLRASGDLVAEVTRWGLEATGLDLDSR